MDIAGLISSFSTGTYSVNRTARGTTVRGRVQSGAASTVSITAAVSPSSGKDVMRLPEGRRSNEARTLFTATQLYAGDQGAAYEADAVIIDGATWEVGHVETWSDPSSSGVGYRCVVTSVST